MGGYGSGTWTRYSTHGTTSQCLRLSVSRLYRRGYLAENRMLYSLSWYTDDELTGSVSAISDANGVRLIYSTREHGEDSKQFAYTVPVVWTPCNFGGKRPWFLCPRCNARVGVLYCRSRFLCRKCHNLRYKSQRQCILGRTIARMAKLESRIGVNGNSLARPKYMRQKTYWRLIEMLTLADEQFDQAFSRKFSTYFDL